MAKQLKMQGLQPRGLYLAMNCKTHNRHALTEVLASEEYRSVLGPVKEFIYEGKLSEELVQVSDAA
jgi:hypothetical protein